MDIFDKCRRFERARELMRSGFYPYFRPLDATRGNRAVIGGREVVMAGSNNYLGLTHDPRVIAAARDALETFGSGCTGSRFLNGTLSLHVELERRLAAFMRREAAVTFSTGFQVNLGVISALVGKNDVVFCDRENHASIIDGCRLSFGEIRKFRHDDPAHLEELLADTDPDAGRLVVVDGVFSMNGTITNLPEILRVARRHGARVMVDDAHGIGVLGARGRGTCEHYGLEDGLDGDPDLRVDLVMGTFSKSLASLGGFIAGDEDVIHFIRHQARSLIFSASISPPNAAAALAALDIIETEPWRIRRLNEIARRMKSTFDALGYNTMGSETPIVPILVGSDIETFAFHKELFERGVFTNPVVSPATPPGRGLIRTSYMATHEDADLDFIAEAFEDLGRKRGLLSGATRSGAPRSTVG